MKPLPRYKSHKVVEALKIRCAEQRPDGNWLLTADNLDATQVIVPVEWYERTGGRCCEVSDPGYFVRYEDGFESWSPSDVFEDGYDLIGDEVDVPSISPEIDEPASISE